jgi:hypothetical protein
LGGLLGASRPIEDDVRGRSAVEAPLAAGWFPIGALVIVAHGAGAETCVEQITADVALRALWAAHFPAAVPSRLKQWFPKAASLARLPAWRVHLGTDAERRSVTTAACLDIVIANAPMPTPP